MRNYIAICNEIRTDWLKIIVCLHAILLNDLEETVLVRVFFTNKATMDSA